MTTGGIIAICVLLALVGAAIIVPPLLKQRAENQLASTCRELEARLAGAALQGGNPKEIADIEAKLVACKKAATAAGIPDMDVGEAVLAGCVARGEQMSQEWAHYKSTTYSDAVKRNNTRNTILRLGEEMARCFSESIDDTTSVKGAESIRSELRKQIAYSVERRTCYVNDMSGCGRFALNEDHGNDKSAAERDRIENKLREQLVRVDAKVIELRAADDAAKSAAARSLTLNKSLGMSVTASDAARRALVGSA